LVLSSHTVFTDGTETLGTPSIKISTGMGVIASGTGLVTQPAMIVLVLRPTVIQENLIIYN